MRRCTVEASSKFALFPRSGTTNRTGDSKYLFWTTFRDEVFFGGELVKLVEKCQRPIFWHIGDELSQGLRGHAYRVRSTRAYVEPPFTEGRQNLGSRCFVSFCLPFLTIQNHSVHLSSPPTNRRNLLFR